LRLQGLLLAASLALAARGAAAAPAWASHAPQRPLPAASDRPKAPGPARFVDPAKGDDAGDGSEAKPWKTVARAAKDLKPGDTLYLRGGICREAIRLSAQGTPEKPITVRAYPGELVVVDRGVPEFWEEPARAWVPFAGGAAGEFVSAKAYPEAETRGEASTNAGGNFGDSMVPLHGPRFIEDLRSDNPYWTAGEGDIPQVAGAKGAKVSKGVQVYCGPGVWLNPETRKVHARLAHTKIPGLEADGFNYKGETDPRKLRLVVALRGRGAPLTLEGARHVRVQDLVLRGGLENQVDMEYCVDITLDGVTAYGGATTLNVKNTVGLRMVDCALRGCSAPWVFRSHLKYRAIESSLMKCGGWSGAGNRDFEIGWCEFTDTIDGLFYGPVSGVKFHHNYVENFSDDCLFVTAPTLYDGRVAGGNVSVTQNYFGRLLTTLSFGVGHGRQKVLPGEKKGRQTGAGVWVARNVFDYRKWVPYQLPKGPDAPQEFTDMGRIAGDHGSPEWEPIFFYQNTLIPGEPSWRNIYGMGLGRTGIGRAAPRCVFNNVFLHAKGLPGMVMADANVNLKADGNLHWSATEGASTDEDAFFGKFRASKAFEQSKGIYAPGWAARDRYADPKFAAFDPKPGAPMDLRLQADSPAIKAGVPLPPECPDPLLVGQEASPDVGALPFNAEPWRVGVRGRYTMFGQLSDPAGHGALQSPPVKPTPEELQPWKPAALVEGYPAFLARYLEYALEQEHFAVNAVDKEWLPVEEFPKYAVVAYDGDLARAGAKTTAFSTDDVPRVKSWLEKGGILLLTQGRFSMFQGAGQAFLSGLGFREVRGRRAAFEPSLQKPGFPWVRHLTAEGANEWLRDKRMGAGPVDVEHAESVLGDEAGRSMLFRLRVGKGQILYVGWNIANFQPNGRDYSRTTLAEDRVFEDQVNILVNLAADLRR
jgi:hypothetical protein